MKKSGSKSTRVPSVVRIGVALLAFDAIGGASLFAQPVGDALKRSIAQTWGQTAQTAATYAKAKTVEKAGRDKEAADTYRQVLQASPKHLLALNNLAYLQAVSDDPNVRDPAEALGNITHATNVLQDLFQKKTLKQLPDTKEMHQALLEIKAVIFRTMAAARAAVGDFDRAADFGGISVRSAQTLVKEAPTPARQQLAALIETDIGAIRAKQALHGLKALPTGLVLE